MRFSLTSSVAALAAVITAAPTFASVSQSIEIPPSPLHVARHIHIPAKAISSDRALVCYIDIDQLKVKDIADTIRVTLSQAPANMRAMAEGLFAIELPKMKKGLLAMRNAGVHGILVFPGPSADGLTLIDGDATTSVHKLATAFHVFARNAANLPKIKRFTGNWYLVSDPNAPSPQFKPDKLVATRFERLLNNAGRAPIRMAAVMNAKTRKAMNHSQSGVAKKLASTFQKLDTATITVRLGKAPRITVRGHFQSPLAARHAHQILLSLIRQGRQFFKKQLKGNQHALPPKLLNRFFNALKPSPHGSTLSLQLKKPFFQMYGHMMAFGLQLAGRPRVQAVHVHPPAHTHTHIHAQHTPSSHRAPQSQP